MSGEYRCRVDCHLRFVVRTLFLSGRCSCRGGSTVAYLYRNYALSVRKMLPEAMQNPAVRRRELHKEHHVLLVVDKPNVAPGSWHSLTHFHPAPAHLNQVGLQWNHDDVKCLPKLYCQSVFSCFETSRYLALP